MPDIERSLLFELATGRSLGRYFFDDQAFDTSTKDVPNTILMRGTQLAGVRERFGRGQAGTSVLVDPLRAQAAELLTFAPPSVCDKSRNVLGGNKNDYVSLAKDWWPVTETDRSAAYEKRDGCANPERFAEHFDYSRLAQMSDAALKLALAAYLTKDKALGLKAASLLEHWFLSPETAQTPHFKTAQIRPGNTEPRGVGLIEARNLIYVCEAASMLSVDDYLAPSQLEKLRDWFRNLLDWMLESPEGLLAGKADDSIALWYHNQCHVYALFVGDTSAAEASLDKLRRLVLEQIAPDGSMPKEMAYENPHDYLAFSLIALSGLRTASGSDDVEPQDCKDEAAPALAAARDRLLETPEAQQIRAWLGDLGGKPGSTPGISQRLDIALAARLFDRAKHTFSKANEDLMRELSTLQAEAEVLQLRAKTVQSAAAKSEVTDSGGKTPALQPERDALILSNQQLRLSNEARRRSGRRKTRFLALLALPYFLVTLPISGPLLLWFLYNRRITLSRPAQPAKKTGSAPKPIINTQSDPAKYYPPSPVDAQADTFALYRIIGNDLFPRHAKGQSFGSVSFILKHEPVLQNCDKYWVLNRIRDTQEKARIMDLLSSAKQKFIDIPFDLTEYQSIGWDFDALPNPGFFASKAFSELDPEQMMRAHVAAYRHKNIYLMNNNGARNLALNEGAGQAKWVLPWDGNCYVTQQGWSDIRQAVAASPRRRYFITPMQRLTDNTALLGDTFMPEPLEEPQVIFRRDAPERFNTAFPYGRRPKVELFWRLGAHGLWDRWRDDAWDQPRRALAPDAGYVGTAGYVARLSSGMDGLEKQNDKASSQLRSVVRNEAIVATIEDADADATNVQSNACAFYPEPALTRLIEPSDKDVQSVNIRKSIVRAAEEALGAGVFSVVDKSTAPPGGDIQDYWHPAPYWWPDPSKSDGRPYIKKDGNRIPGTELYDPTSNQFDRTRLQRMFDNTTILALAAKVTGRRDFAAHGAALIRTWFIDPDRRMNPHLRYAQVRQGHNADTGAASGIIEFKDVYFLLDAVRILERLGALKEEDSAAFRGWLTDYQNWLESSEQGREECAKINNHGTYFDLQAAAIASYLGDEQRIRAIYFRAQSRLVQQISEDGEQPEEMKRTLTQHYVHFNLQGLLNIIRIMQAKGRPIPLQNSEPGKRLAAALEWVLRRDQSVWPYQQTEPFDLDRTAVLAATAASLGSLPDGMTAKAAPEAAYKPIFNPHDAVHPFWMLS